MPTDLYKLFATLGLLPSETKIYLASLGLGPTSVQEIAKKAVLSRTAAYEAIESLQKRGLMSTFARGKKKFFAAEDPERAVAHFRETVSNMQTHLETLARVLPEVKMMAGGERPAVRFYEGNEALYALFSDVAKIAPEQVDEVANLDDVYGFLDNKVLADVRKLLDPKRTKIRILHIGETKNPRPEISYCRIDDQNKFHGDIWIYGNRVAFVSFVGKVITVILESQPFADTARFLFETAWRVCTRAPLPKGDACPPKSGS